MADRDIAHASDPFPRARPEEVGVDPAHLAELTSRIRTWVDHEDAVGAEILVIKKRRTVLHEAYGLQDLDDRTPLRPGTIACIRSMTKPLVGTAVQILVDDWRKSFTAVEVVRRDTIEGTGVWVVRLTGREMPPVTRYVAIGTGLVIREETWITVKGAGTVPMLVTFGDYRPVAGVMLPFRAESTSALTGKQVTEYQEIRAK